MGSGVMRILACRLSAHPSTVCEVPSIYADNAIGQARTERRYSRSWRSSMLRSLTMMAELKKDRINGIYQARTVTVVSPSDSRDGVRRLAGACRILDQVVMAGAVPAIRCKHQPVHLVAVVEARKDERRPNTVLHVLLADRPKSPIVPGGRSVRVLSSSISREKTAFPLRICMHDS